MLSRTLWATALSASIGLVGCDGCREDDSSQRAVVAPKPPVAAPTGLVAKLVIPHPGKTIGELREAAGGAAALFPRSVGGWVASQLGLPLQAVEHFDDNLPVVGAATMGDDGMHVGVAFHVRDTARVIAASTKGADAKFSSEKDVGEGALDDSFFLVPTGKSIRKPEIDAALLMVDSYLVAADSREGARHVAHYLTRTLSRETNAVADVVVDVQDGFAEPLPLLLRDLRAFVSEGALPPQLAALIDVDAVVDEVEAMAGKLRGGRVTLDLNRDAMVATALLGSDGPWIDLAPDASPDGLLDLPQDVVLAGSWMEEAADERSKLIAMVGEALGAGWTAEDDAALTKAVGQLGEGRGPSTQMGLRCTGVGLTGLAQGTVADKKLLDEALMSLVGMHAHEAVQKKLRDGEIDLTAKRTRILEVPDELWRLRLRPRPRGDSVPEEIDMLALVRKDAYFVTAGMETVDTLQRLDAPDADRALRTKAPIASQIANVVSAVGQGVWLTLMIDPQAIHACSVGKPGGAAAAPITVAMGPTRDGGVHLRAEVARELLRALPQLMR